MEYQVLARKWRPRFFRELVGQGHVVEALLNGSRQNRLHHAYLLTGTRGVGKTTIARILAKSINCLHPQDGEPCGRCEVCVAIDGGRFADVIEIDGASNNGIDNVKRLIEDSRYAPSLGKCKVYIIDECHMLTTSAWNAMLKTLEEPPDYVKFILATTDPQKVPVTVLSRCLQFVLRNLSPDQVLGHLRRIAQIEGVSVEDDALAVISRAAMGSMRDGLSLFDQAIALGGGQVTARGAREMLGVIDRLYLFDLLEAVAKGDGEACKSLLDDLKSKGVGFESTLNQMALMLLELAGFFAAPSSLSSAGEDRARFESLMKLASPETVQLYYQIAVTGKKDLPYAPDDYSGFLMTVLRMLAFAPIVPRPFERGGSVEGTDLRDPRPAASRKDGPIGQEGQEGRAGAGAPGPAQEDRPDAPRKGGAQNGTDGDKKKIPLKENPPLEASAAESAAVYGCDPAMDSAPASGLGAPAGSQAQAGSVGAKEREGSEKSGGADPGAGADGAGRSAPGEKTQKTDGARGLSPDQTRSEVDDRLVGSGARAAPAPFGRRAGASGGAETNPAPCDLGRAKTPGLARAEQAASPVPAAFSQTSSLAPDRERPQGAADSSTPGGLGAQDPSGKASVPAPFSPPSNPSLSSSNPSPASSCGAGSVLPERRRAWGRDSDPAPKAGPERADGAFAGKRGGWREAMDRGDRPGLGDRWERGELGRPRPAGAGGEPRMTRPAPAFGARFDEPGRQAPPRAARIERSGGRGAETIGRSREEGGIRADRDADPEAYPGRGERDRPGRARGFGADDRSRPARTEQRARESDGPDRGGRGVRGGMGEMDAWDGAPGRGDWPDAPLDPREFGAAGDADYWDADGGPAPRGPDGGADDSFDNYWFDEPADAGASAGTERWAKSLKDVGEPDFDLSVQNWPLAIDLMRAMSDSSTLTTFLNYTAIVSVDSLRDGDVARLAFNPTREHFTGKSLCADGLRLASAALTKAFGRKVTCVTAPWQKGLRSHDSEIEEMAAARREQDLKTLLSDEGALALRQALGGLWRLAPGAREAPKPKVKKRPEPDSAESGRQDGARRAEATPATEATRAGKSAPAAKPARGAKAAKAPQAPRVRNPTDLASGAQNAAKAAAADDSGPPPTKAKGARRPKQGC